MTADRRVPLLFFFASTLAATSFGCATSNAPQSNGGSGGSGTGNAIVRENAKPGDPSWRIMHPNPRDQIIIDGFASTTSVNRGGTISLFVNTVAPSYNIDIFRIGWYQGIGARRMLPTITRTGTNQPIPSADPATGLIEAVWTDPYVLAIPNDATDPTNWASGVYVAKLTAPTGASVTESYIIFIVRDDSRPSDLLFQSSTNTYQAYNTWGGRSLYSNPRAYKVSYNRPYLDGWGTGEFFRWEYNMLHFLEREGYDVTYNTDVDTHENASMSAAHKGVLIVGHDEYWSWNMFDHFQSAQSSGVNLGFFSADDGFWQVRLEPSLMGGQDRTVVCYRIPSLDPDSAEPSTAHLTTSPFRFPPVDRPEQAVIGEMFDDTAETNIQGDIVVSDAADPVFQNTDLQNGDTLPGLLGNETDAVLGTLPATETILAHSMFFNTVTNRTSFSDMTISISPPGGIVFAAGTIHWSWGLDDDNFYTLHPIFTNTAAQQITRNILQQFGAMH